MCGIAGFWGPPAPAERLDSVLADMVRSLAHRGPDGNGAWSAPQDGLGLAHTRLAILDLSDAGRQPMSSARGRYQIVCNGEIYNFMELRAVLEQEGHAPARGWRSRCDTDPLLQALAVWGVEQALRRCIGMFALALWDSRDKRLWLARDRMGVKPLYFGWCGDSLVFGSELKALRCHPEFAPTISRTGLEQYLRLACVPAPGSIFQGVYKLPPGAILCFEQGDILARRVPRPRFYWSLSEVIEQGRQAPLLGDEEEITDELEQLLLDAVRLRLVSDAPLGAFLSGGVDSSTVVALMQELGARPVRAFCIGSQARGFNEAHWARAVAKRLEIEHCELVATPPQAMGVIPELPRIHDEPFADFSQVPMLLVSRLARREVAVCLSGDGGDELFGGYNRHFHGPRLWARLQELPLPLRRVLSKILRGPAEVLLAGTYAMFTPRARRPLHLGHKVHQAVQAMPAADMEAFYRALVSVWPEPGVLLAGAQSVGMDPVLEALTPPPCAEDLDCASWIMARDQAGYLPDDILTKLDRAGMAVGLEPREPLLDHRLVEFSWRLPLEMKTGGAVQAGQGKRILRRVLARRLPLDLVERPKQGFGLPLGEWLRGPLREWAEPLLAPPELEAGGLRPASIRRAWQAHQKGRDAPLRLWTVLMYQAWRREYGL